MLASHVVSSLRSRPASVQTLTKIVENEYGK